jgi:hypothetical protein
VNWRVRSGIVEIESKDPYMRSFLVPGDLGNVRVNVWKKGELYTVGTYMHHPKKGKTQLFRRNCTEKEVREILKNPRLHTGKGYR